MNVPTILQRLIDLLKSIRNCILKKKPSLDLHSDAST